MSRVARLRRREALAATLLTGAAALHGTVSATDAVAAGRPHVGRDATRRTHPWRTGTDADLIDRSPGLVRPRHLVVDAGLSEARARECVRLAQELYTFWDTGDVRHLRRAVVADFRDNTPPPGRAQGRAGVVAASRAFRAAVPDLRCELHDLAIAGDRITARQVYRGRFTGVYDGVHGRGQSVRFDAIDIQRVGRTRIVEDWHLEDTSAFLRQLGFVTAPAPVGGA
ncbi:ester cyclase [Patulibacter sp.]|uniref:ester cyclase n=1 Tax=Patulibacter sp. TaxID=1912859 RepID=UPI00271E8FF2|nr:ester cyclase [Patulibacter sp.]MDO9408869.1 ester cyclase [Patulibacter sp.]